MGELDDSYRRDASGDLADRKAPRRTPAPDPSDSVVQAVRRWELSGGEWQVLGRRDGTVTVGLYTCDAHELMDRVSGPETPAVTRLLAESDASAGRA